MRKYFLALLSLLISLQSYSQDFSNKGKDFWVGYGYHTIMTTNNAQQMVLYFATDQITNVTVTIPGTGYTQTYNNISANSVFTSDPIPKTGAQDARLFSETVAPENKGIHIVSDKPMVAYAHTYNQSVSGATILFPTNTLGKEYYSINYKNISNTNNANCWFYVIACDTGTTTVEIVPSANTLTHAAGVPFTVSLTQGQIYNFMGQLTGGGGGLFTGVDLTGSKVKSIATGTGTCKRIGVFSGSGRISITCTGNSSSSDNYMVQSLPKNAWGKKYLTAPTGGLLPNTIYRVCVSDPAAVVILNGTPITYPLINNFYYEIPATPAPLKIESNLPIMVAEYFTSPSACGNPVQGNPGQGDPEVIYLSPVEQNISKVLWNATPIFSINTHYYSVVIPNSGTAISSFKLDGVAVNPFAFTVHPQDPNFSFLVQSVVSGPRRIESDSGFNAIAYGFGSAESYGYNAGTNVKDLYQQIGVSSQYGIETTPSVCTGSSFKFKVSLPYLADSIRWDLSNLPGSPANILINYSNPPVPGDADSIKVVNGKTIYWYSLPTFYNFTGVGIFPVTITTYAPNAEGCGNEQQIDFNLEISNPPIADFNWAHNGCVNQTVQFNDITITTKPTYKWWWSFGDPSSGAANNSTLQNPTHAFSTPGTYSVRYANITTPGCLSDTILKQIVINPLPTANVSGNIIVCNNAPSPNVTFTGVIGTAPFTFNYNINNGPNLTAVTTSGNSVSVPASTAIIGTFSYHLVSVLDAAGTAGCFQNQIDTVVVIVNPLPTATITGNNNVCQNAASPFITFTAVGGSVAPFTFTYKINGGANITVTTIAGNAVTVAVPTNVTGAFIYTLVSVSDASATACSQNLAGSVTIRINPLPTAVISGTTEVCINATSPVVTFTGAGSIAPYTFTYTLNAGAPQTITSTGNTASIVVPTTTALNYTYQLVSVRDASTTLCSQLQNGTVTVVVNPLPTGNFNITSPGCVSRSISFQDISVANVGTINAWSWNFGDPASGAANTSALPNPTHIYTTAASYPVTLTVTNTKGCRSVIFNRIILINPLPSAGFILPEVCLLDPFAQFTDTSSVLPTQNITGWLWNFGDPASGAANTSNIQNGQHTYPAVGNYTVQLIVSTNNGCTDTLPQVLTVNGGNPVAAFIQLNTNSSCSNDSVSIQNKSTIGSGNITKVDIYWNNTLQPTVLETDDFPTFNKLYKHKYPLSVITQTYDIRFRAFSGGVCVSDRIATVTVLATPDVQINNIPNQCYSNAPLPLNFGSQIGNVAGAESYSGPGVSFAGGWQFLASSAGIGTHTIQYKFTAAAGGCADSVTTTITVLDTASARFQIIAPLCEKNNITFKDISTVPAGQMLMNTTWDFGDASPPETHLPGTSLTHIFSAATSYTVNMYNTTTTGCRSTVTTQIVAIKPLPIANFSFIDTICLPAASVIFTNLSSIADGTQNAFTYQWNFGDAASGINNTATSLTPTHVYNSTGPYNVRLTVTSNAGCIDDTNITVNTIRPQPIANFSFDKPGICIGDDITFTDESNGIDGTIGTWRWNFDDGNNSQDQNPFHLYNTPGAYNVSLYIINSFGCSDTVKKLFTVHPYPVVDAGPDRFVLEGGSIVLEPIVTANDALYLWEPATYLNNNTIAKPLTTPLSDIAYKLTVTARGGCSDSDIVIIKLLKGPKIPNTFTPNGDGVNEKWVIEYLDTYPNNRVQIFTRAGQLVFESRGYKNPWNGTMNGKSLPLDTYYYIIEPENGRKPITGYVTILK